MNRKKTLLTITLSLISSVFASPSYCQTLLYSNGGFSTGTLSKSGVSSPANYTWSELQNEAGNTTETNKSAGFAGYSNSAGTSVFQLADDFVVPNGQQWNISSFNFFVYQNSYTGSSIPVEQLRIQIWNGDPSLASSSVVFGNMTNNVLDASGGGNTFTYRITNSFIGSPALAPNLNRVIWKIKGNVNVTLTPGTYWVVYQYQATNGGITTFSPTVTVPDSRGLAGWNAKQNFIANVTPGQALGWTNVVDVGNPSTAADFPQDLPFEINGSTSCLSTNDNDFSASIALFPNPAQDSLNISSGYTLDSIEIFDQTGRSLKKITDKLDAVDVSDFSTGTYIVRIQSGKNVSIKKFIKK